MEFLGINSYLGLALTPHCGRSVAGCGLHAFVEFRLVHGRGGQPRWVECPPTPGLPQ